MITTEDMFKAERDLNIRLEARVSELERKLYKATKRTAAEGENLHAKMRELDAALIAALKRAEKAERNAQRYLHIRVWGIPCSERDFCGSCTGDKLDAQVYAARKP